MNFVFCGVITIGGIGLIIRDYQTTKRIENELPVLEELKTDAKIQKNLSSNESIIFVMSSEKQIFEIMESNLEDIIQSERRYQNGIPILRALFTPPRAKDIVGYCICQIYTYDDGDHYDSFSDYITRCNKKFQ